MDNKMSQERSEDKETIEASKVSVKIPPFWVDKPEIWFAQVEAQFTISNITSEYTKFNYLISQLEPRYVENIWDIIASTSSAKYSEAKERLLNIFKESEACRIQRLVTGMDLGDMKPSQLLQKLRSLATDVISDKVLKTLWLQKLPDNIRNVLLVSEEELAKLAIMADKISEMSPKSELYSINKESKLTEDLVSRIASLEQAIAKLSIDRQPRPRSNATSRSSSRNRSRSRKRFDPRGKYCYYHFRFGSRCIPEKCQPPCSWMNSENSNTQQN